MKNLTSSNTTKTSNVAFLLALVVGFTLNLTAIANITCTQDALGDSHCSSAGGASGKMTPNGNFKVNAGHGQTYTGYQDPKTGKFTAKDQAGVEYKGHQLPNGQFKIDGNNGLSVQGNKDTATLQFQGEEHTCTFKSDGTMSCPSLGL
jgi:hypothetical protein